MARVELLARSIRFCLVSVHEKWQRSRQLQPSRTCHQDKLFMYWAHVQYTHRRILLCWLLLLLLLPLVLLPSPYNTPSTGIHIRICASAFACVFVFCKCTVVPKIDEAIRWFYCFLVSPAIWTDTNEKLAPIISVNHLQLKPMRTLVRCTAIRIWNAYGLTHGIQKM